MHAARMYPLVLDGRPMGPLKAFLDLAVRSKPGGIFSSFSLRLDPVRRRARQFGGCVLLLNRVSDSGIREDFNASA